MNKETIDIVDSVAWPIAAVLIAWALRESINTVIVMFYVSIMAILGVDIEYTKR